MKMMRDVNGGYWGLIIIFSAFMVQFFTFGIGLSIGLYNIEFLTLTDDAFAVSLVSAINTGVIFGSGPVVSVLMNHLSHRTVVLIGAALSSSSLLCMPFLPSIQYMYGIYGVVAGFGFSFAYVPSHVLSGLYYTTNHQSMSTGIATAGSGLGATAFPILVGYLIETYTWRPSLLVIAGLMFNLFVFALLLRPLPKSKMPGPIEDMCRDGKKKKKGRILQYVSLCFDLKFVIFCISNVLWNIGVTMVMMFGPDFLTERGFSKMHTAVIYTIFGFCSCVGSVLTGVLGSHPRVNRLSLYVSVCILGGGAAFCLPFAISTLSMTAAHVIVGLGFGGVLGLLVVLTADILGPENLGNGVGFLLLADGVGCFAGPPIVGLLKNHLGTYDVSLHAAGAVFCLGGLVMVLIPLQAKLSLQMRRLNTRTSDKEEIQPMN